MSLMPGATVVMRAGPVLIGSPSIVTKLEAGLAYYEAHPSPNERAKARTLRRWVKTGTL
jgi:hypothetical protein